jgi:hypothetical protein
MSNNNQNEQQPEPTVVVPTVKKPQEECQKTEEKECNNSHQKECENLHSKEDNNLHSYLNKCPRWLRIVLSIALLVAAYKWFPILEILQIFTFVVIVPLLVLSLVGLVTADTYNSIVEALDAVKNKVADEAKKAATA